jgi:carbonic anhydrase
VAKFDKWAGVPTGEVSQAPDLHQGIEIPSQYQVGGGSILFVVSIGSARPRSPRQTSTIGGDYRNQPRRLMMTSIRCSISSCLVLLCTIGFLSGGCTPAPEPAPTSLPKPLVETVLTQEEQDLLTPEIVLELLRAGNQRFVSGTLTTRDHSSQVRAAATGQFPKAIVLSCVDSRVPVEDVFDRGIGDVFVARVAGNFENTDILGSMEFATAAAGAKLVLVLGHYECGAVKGAIDGVELGNITAMVANIRPAVEHFASYEGDKTSANDEFVRMVTEQNVRLTIADIRERSPLLSEMEDAGQIRIMGAVYDMESGAVHLLDE